MGAGRRQRDGALHFCLQKVHDWGKEKKWVRDGAPEEFF